MLLLKNTLKVITVFFCLSQSLVCKSFAQNASTAGSIRTEWRSLSVQQEARFVSLVDKRNQIQQDMTVLARLLDEKMTEKKMIDETFLRHFAIAADESYRFDRNTRSVYRILGPSQEVLHKSLTEEQSRTFMRYAEVRKRIQVGLDGIHVRSGQKKKQWEKGRDELLKEFGIQHDKNYHYDKQTRVIYKQE